MIPRGIVAGKLDGAWQDVFPAARHSDLLALQTVSSRSQGTGAYSNLAPKIGNNEID